MKDIIIGEHCKSPNTNEILKMYRDSFDGELDVIVVMNSAYYIMGILDGAFGDKANKVYFTPEFTTYRLHNLKTDGTLLISDCITFLVLANTL